MTGRVVYTGRIQGQSTLCAQKINVGLHFCLLFVED